MSTKLTIHTQCPVCSRRYDVPAKAVGHRARCTGCHSQFRVRERPRHPTEDDILRWLSEAEEPDVIEQPEIVGRREDHAPRPPESRAPDELGAAHRLDGRAADLPGAEAALRRTG
jgi:hypothetical protein